MVKGPSRRTEMVLRVTPSSTLTSSSKTCRKAAAPSEPGGAALAAGGGGSAVAGSSSVPPHSEGTSTAARLPCAAAGSLATSTALYGTNV